MGQHQVEKHAQHKGLRRRRDRERGRKLFDKIMTKNFPNLRKETNIQVHEAQRVPNKITQRDPHQDTIIKTSKVKDKNRIIKSIRERQIDTYEENPTGL